MSTDCELSSNGKVFKKYLRTDSEFTIPDGVKTIGTDAFKNCATLKSIVIPDGVKTIGWGAFYGCKSLTSIELPDSVKEIGTVAFCGCTSLKSIAVPRRVKTIWEKAFYGCSSLKSIILPESLKVIGESAFYGCSSLTSIVVPDSVRKIAERAFDRCSALTSVFIPKRVKKIGLGAFGGCPSLKSFEVDENNRNYRSDDGVLFSKDGKTLVKVPGGASLETFFVSNEIKKIRRDAFYACRSLQSIDVAEDNLNYRSIDGVLFSKDGKELVEFPEGMKKERFPVAEDVKLASFGACPSLEFVDVAENNPRYRSVDGVLFSKNEKSLIKFPGGMKKESFVVPESVEEIADEAFADCSSLTSIIIPGTVNGIGWEAFRSCSSLESVVVQEGVESIGPLAFADCPALKSVVLPKSVEFFGGCAFWDEDGECVELEFVGEGVFYGCEALTIRAPKGSPAERYARECGLDFEPVE